VSGGGQRVKPAREEMVCCLRRVLGSVSAAAKKATAMTRQESGVIAVCISTYGSTLFADFLVEPPEQVINLRACSPVSSLTFLSTMGRKDGLLTVIFQTSSVVLQNSAVRTTGSFSGGEEVNHDNSPPDSTGCCEDHAANHQTLRLMMISCMGKHSLEQLEHSRKVRSMQLEHSRLARSMNLHSSCCHRSSHRT
jgi:hypothetical protein